MLRPILRIGPFWDTEMGQPVSRWDNCKKIFHHSNTYRRLCSLSFIVNSQLNSIRPSYMYMANVSFRCIYIYLIKRGEIKNTFSEKYLE